MEALLGECCHIAASEDQMIRPDVLQRTRTLLTQAGSTFTASMLRDLERGTVTEADHILGDLLDRQSELAVISPSLLRIAYLHLKTTGYSLPSSDPYRSWLASPWERRPRPVARKSVSVST
jgi:2-dehydropantoate 2-reductase